MNLADMSASNEPTHEYDAPPELCKKVTVFPSIRNVVNGSLVLNPKFPGHAAEWEVRALLINTKNRPFYEPYYGLTPFFVG
jgi:hypothetical protein